LSKATVASSSRPLKGCASSMSPRIRCRTTTFGPPWTPRKSAAGSPGSKGNG
jgi:hypothetical protein